MNFKKLVCLTIAFAMAFAPVVSAQGPCQTCEIKNGSDVLIFDPSTQAECEQISYELHPEYNHRLGYVGGMGKMILDVCECPLTNRYFKLHQIVGIRLTILTDGVYWTNQPIAIQPFQGTDVAIEQQACNGAIGTAGGVSVSSAAETPAGNPLIGPDNVITEANTALPNVVYDTEKSLTGPVLANRVFLPPMTIEDGEIIPREGYDTPTRWRWNGTQQVWEVDPTYPAVPGALTGALAAANATNAAQNGAHSTAEYEYYKANGTTRVATGNVMSPNGNKNSTNCVVPAAAQAKIVEVKRAYQIGYIDVTFNLCKWWIDLPNMVKNIAEVNPNDTLRVRVDILYDEEQGLCDEPLVICTCDETLGVFGSDSRSMYFPYVLINNDAWWTGIVVTNMDTDATPIANMEATFTLYDSTGKKFTYEKKAGDFASSVDVFLLDSVLSEFDGTPKTGPGWLKVQTNFSVDGYEFLSDNNFGAGTLPRGIAVECK